MAYAQTHNRYEPRHVDLEVVNPSSRAPAADHILSTATKFNIAVVCVKGNISVARIVEDLAGLVREKAGYWPILLLGPTAPSDLRRLGRLKAGWVTFLEEGSGSEEIAIISPHSLLEISLFIEKNTASLARYESVVVGDFLDNVLCAVGANSLDAFFSFYCQLAARVKRDGRICVLVVKEDLHDPKKLEIVRRFADLIIEYRTKEDQNTIRPEVRVLDFSNQVHVNWTSENLSEKLRAALG
jgi:hypothetical protein